MNKMMCVAMKNPPHPGGIVKDCIEDLELSIVDAAQVLGVPTEILSNIVSEKSPISPEMAIRLEIAFGGTAQMWLRMQAAYDLAQVRNNIMPINVQRYKPSLVPA